MRQTVNLCNFCHKHVVAEKDGVIIRHDGADELFTRIFDKATVNDVCFCTDCADQALKILNKHLRE